MLQPAHVGHLAMLRSLIREGAKDGSFDKELGASSPEAEAFFAKLKRALVTGYFVEEGRSGRIDTIAVPGNCYWADARARRRVLRRGRPLRPHRHHRGPGVRLLAGRPQHRLRAGRLRPLPWHR